MILFETIRYKNLLSTGDQFTEIRLDDHQTTLVLGENGAGKSTLLDALCFGLFGRGFRNLKKELLINSINNKALLVEIEFTIGRTSYKIVRGMKPNKFEIYADNELVSQDASVRDYQSHLEKHILKTSFRSFTQVAILGSANFVPFMQLKAKDRRELVEDLLDISIFSTMQNILRQRVTNHITNVSENKHGIELLEERIHGLHGQIKALRDNRAGEIKRYSKTIEESQQHIASLLQSSSSNDLNIDTYKKIIGDKSKIETARMESQSAINKIQNTQNNVKKVLSFFRDEDVCPTCSQSISSELKDKKIGECDHELSVHKKQMTSETRKAKRHDKRMSEIAITEQFITNLSKQNQELANEILTNQKYIKKLASEISDLESQRTQNDGVHDKILEAEDILDRLHKKKESLASYGHYLDIAKLLLKDQGVKEKIIKQYVPIMNKMINKYLAQLEFYVGFELDESFDETIKSRFRDVFKYDNFSQGEKMRIDLALLFAWRGIARMKNSVSTNLLVLDEVFDSSLDVSGTEDFLKLLGAMKEKTNAFIISHKGDMLYDRFENVLRFEKHKNFSRIAD